MRSSLGIVVLDEDYTLFRELELYAAAQGDEDARQTARQQRQQRHRR